MPKPQYPRETSLKKQLRAQLKSHKSPQVRSSGLKTTPEPSPLFHSKKFKGHFKKESVVSEQQQGKWSNKVMTTDESNNGMESKLQESVILSERRLPNEEYFNDPLMFKNKKRGVPQSKIHQGRLENLSIKLSQINRLVSSQEKELKTMKQSVSERELYRLTKIHSIEKLKLVERICGQPAQLKRSRV